MQFLDFRQYSLFVLIFMATSKSVESQSRLYPIFAVYVAIGIKIVEQPQQDQLYSSFAHRRSERKIENRK